MSKGKLKILEHEWSGTPRGLKPLIYLAADAALKAPLFHAKEPRFREAVSSIGTIVP